VEKGTILAASTIVKWWNNLMTSFSTDDLVRAPTFPTDLDWINTDTPLRLEDLRGKFVLLDFFSYG
jgi:hypothetical protein